MGLIRLALLLAASLMAETVNEARVIGCLVLTSRRHQVDSRGCAPACCKAAGRRKHPTAAWPVPTRHLVVTLGRIEVDGEPMGPLDGVAITNGQPLSLQPSELVVVEAG